MESGDDIISMLFKMISVVQNCGDEQKQRGYLFFIQVRMPPRGELQEESFFVNQNSINDGRNATKILSASIGFLSVEAGFLC